MHSWMWRIVTLLRNKFLKMPLFHYMTAPSKGISTRYVQDEGFTVDCEYVFCHRSCYVGQLVLNFMRCWMSR